MPRLLLVFGIVLVLAACKKELVSTFKAQRSFAVKICSVKPLTPVGLGQIYGCTNTLFALQTAFSDSFRVVRSQAAFDSLLSGACSPAVNFSQYDLIVGQRQLISGIDSVSYTLLHNCPESRYEVSVQFHKNLSLMAPRVTWHLLLPKLKAGEVVQVTYR
ncbi:MAG: hypothetical protein MUF24_14815 [Chitinophagaceae bacterium]|nr:hypothetical protein [Chitinophagaceae bacterium]